VEPRRADLAQARLSAHRRCGFAEYDEAVRPRGAGWSPLRSAFDA